MRSGYSDDLDGREMNLYRGTVSRAIGGKRGQALLRTLLKALDEMPVKRLIPEELVDGDGEVCLLGAGGKQMGIADIADLDPKEHNELAQRFNVAQCLIQEIEYINDEACFRSDETPEQRYERVRKWLIENIKPAAAA